MILKNNLFCLALFCFCITNGLAQNLVITEKSIDGFIQDILKDKRVDYVYSKRGQIFSDFHILDNNEKVICINRVWGQIISKGTPIVFLDEKNFTKESLFVSSWPPGGTPERFPPLSMLDNRLIFIPSLVYPSKEILESPKKPTRGFLAGIQNQDEIRFFDFSSPNNLFGKYFSYDPRKEMLSFKKNEISFISQDFFFRHKDDKIMIYNAKTKEFFLFQKSTGILEQRFVYSEKELVNFELVAQNKIIISAKNKESSDYEILMLDLDSKEIDVLYTSHYYLVRVKGFDQGIYFEIAAKFSDSEVPESILFKIKI